MAYRRDPGPDGGGEQSSGTPTEGEGSTGGDTDNSWMFAVEDGDWAHEMGIINDS